MIVVPFSTPIAKIIQKRYSCRTYLPARLEDWLHQKFTPFLDKPLLGIWGNTLRITLVFNAQAQEQRVRLGTYGFIQGAVEYLVGIISNPNALVEFGHLFEQVILYATDIGLGTCWIGGSFKRSAFAQAAHLQPGEIIPAISPLGYIKSEQTLREQFIRFIVHSDNRKPWEELFFDAQLQPLSRAEAAPYTEALEMVRQAPSASNKQPWRIVRDPKGFHFYLQPTSGHPRRGKLDLQQIDLGIALCHFELTAQEARLTGSWQQEPPELAVPQDWSYIASWLT